MKLLIEEESTEDFELLCRLRYQVYCQEANFLDPRDYSNGLEFDEFDTVSEHFVIKNPCNINNVIGTVRLVKWSDEYSFPTAVYFDSLLELLDNKKFPIDSTAEISRLCISKQNRRRPMDELYWRERNVENCEQLRKHPAIIFELFKIMYTTSRNDLGITHWIATFAPSLRRLLERYGVYFELLVSEEIDYYGKVNIYGASIEQLEEGMKINKPELYDFFCYPPIGASCKSLIVCNQSTIISSQSV